MDHNSQAIYSQKLTDQQFFRIADLLYNGYGLKMPYTKKIMMEGRLKSRLMATEISDFSSYIDYLFSNEGKQEELVHMVDALTTNKTDFFRENHHFEFLKDNVLPSLSTSHLKIWSAGCSSGEEPYSIAITLKEAQQQTPFTFEILGTDLSYKVLQVASKAVYPSDAVGLSLERKMSFFLKSKNTDTPTIRVNKYLRRTVKFQRLNLVTPPYSITNHKFDLIFFRNVMIYFDRITQQKVLTALCDKLKTGGFLFIGHSESITSLDLPLKQVEPTVFIKL